MAYKSVLDLISYLRELNMASLALRLTFAMLFGGLIGLERERKRRPAGFRTYMIVCLGAALTMLLSQYELLMFQTRWASFLESTSARTDVSRFGAQVISGIGFLGAGTIIVTGRHEVKGLTTAAGLWASACMGLAIGAGFYECMLIGFVLIILCIRIFPSIENAVLSNGRYMNIYVEFVSLDDIGALISHFKGDGIKIFDIDLEEPNKRLEHPSATFYLCLPRKTPHTEIIASISLYENICAIEEL